MNNIQKYIVLLLTVMLLVPDSAWATEQAEFVIKGSEDNLGPVAGASIVAQNQPDNYQLRWRVYHKGGSLWCTSRTFIGYQTVEIPGVIDQRPE